MIVNMTAEEIKKDLVLQSQVEHRIIDYFHFSSFWLHVRNYICDKPDNALIPHPAGYRVGRRSYAIACEDAVAAWDYNDKNIKITFVILKIEVNWNLENCESESLTDSHRVVLPVDVIGNIELFDTWVANKEGENIKKQLEKDWAEYQRLKEVFANAPE